MSDSEIISMVLDREFDVQRNGVCIYWCSLDVDGGYEVYHEDGHFAKHFDDKEEAIRFFLDRVKDVYRD